MRNSSGKQLAIGSSIRMSPVIYDVLSFKAGIRHQHDKQSIRKAALSYKNVEIAWHFLAKWGSRSTRLHFHSVFRCLRRARSNTKIVYKIGDLHRTFVHTEAGVKAMTRLYKDEVEYLMKYSPSSLLVEVWYFVVLYQWFFSERTYR